MTDRKVELIRSELDSPILVELLDTWRGELNSVMVMRQDDLTRAVRTATGQSRHHIIYGEVMRGYQPIVDYLIGKIIEIERLRPPMVRLIE